MNIAYIRVPPSRRAEEELEERLIIMRSRHPSHEIIYDISHVLDYQRSGLRKLLNLANRGELDNLIVSSEDHIARFGMDVVYKLLDNREVQLLVDPMCEPPSVREDIEHSLDNSVEEVLCLLKGVLETR